MAVIEGYAVGGGLELALACDVRIATSSARFGLVELGIGSIASWGGIQRLVRAVGPSRARALMYTARVIDAAEALAIGLVADVFPDDELEIRFAQWCENLTKLPPLALAATKEAVLRSIERPIRENLVRDAESFARLSMSGGFEEGVAAFLEKRTPEYRGR